jgi:uncharacterized protein YutE (UPF0331/DUF86 family)/predicted nucleotidyltransferase
MHDVGTAVLRLRHAAELGGLDEFCARHQVRVLTVFGSAGRGEPHPRDLDVGLLTEPGAALNTTVAVLDLVELAGTEFLDVADLARSGPVLRERALVGSVALYESEPGALAAAQIAAIGERVDTDAMRRLNLQLLTGTPRKLDWRAMQPKLRAIDELLDQLVVDERRLQAERITALAVERVLTLVVDLAFAVNGHVAAAVLGRAPDSYAESFALAAQSGMIEPDLAGALRPSAGTRNVLVHGYLEVDHRQVAAAIPLALRDYRTYVQQAARWLEGRLYDEPKDA